jgi:hypothetical protein
MDLQLTSFHLFSQFPEAIRLQIWLYAALVPRVVEIHEFHSNSYGSHLPKSGEQTSRVESKTRPPAVLHACRESRKLGLENVFEPAYANCSNVNYSILPPIYINPALDITYRDKKSC